MKRTKMFPDDPYDLDNLLLELKNIYNFNWFIRLYEYEFMKYKNSYNEIYLLLINDIEIRISTSSYISKYDNIEFNCIHYILKSNSNNYYTSLVVNKDMLFRLLKIDLTNLGVFKKPVQLSLI